MTEAKYTERLGRDVQLRPGTSDAQTWVDTFDMGYHVPPTIQPKAVLDLGANIGLTAADYAQMWPEAMVVAVEMDAKNAQVCRSNFAGRVIVTAVGAFAGDASYERGSWAASYSLLRPGTVLTKVQTLEQILDDTMAKSEEVFCKMDIEGAEWAIFSHGVDKRVKWLLVELHGDDPSDVMVERGTDLLKENGFAVMRHPNHPHALWAVR